MGEDRKKEINKQENVSQILRSPFLSLHAIKRIPSAPLKLLCLYLGDPSRCQAAFESRPNNTDGKKRETHPVQLYLNSCFLLQHIGYYLLFSDQIAGPYILSRVHKCIQQETHVFTPFFQKPILHPLGFISIVISSNCIRFFFKSFCSV